jgi:transcriptional regulator
MLILKAFSLGPLHGYGIIQRLRQLSDEMLEVEQGSLYPAVYRIEQRGWISSKWGVTETGRRAKFYTLTKAEANNSPPRKRAGIGSPWPL